MGRKNKNQMKHIIKTFIGGLLAMSLTSCYYDDKKTLYMQLLPNHSVEKEDVIGKTWMSDDNKYYLPFHKKGVWNSTGAVLLITFPSKKLSMTYHGGGSLLCKAAERSACDHFLG